MMNRRRFLKRAGAFLGVATVAPSVALEVAKTQPGLNWRHLTPEDIEADITALLEQTVWTDASWKLPVYLRTLLTSLCGKQWGVEEFAPMAFRFHLPAYISDCTKPLLEEVIGNQRCMGILFEYEYDCVLPMRDDLPEFQTMQFKDI